MSRLVCRGNTFFTLLENRTLLYLTVSNNTVCTVSLKVENIYKTYDKKSVLNGVSLYADDNRIVGLLGPNGAGKSTLMKIITGYVTPDSGQVEVCGEKISSNAIDYKKNIGYLPEHNPLYLDMYVKEYLTHIAELYGIKDTQRAVAEVVEKTGLTPEKHKIIRQLSKGYRQRVGLAQAIIHNPKVLILDEPTTGLDPNQIIEIRQLIADFGKRHTVLFSTHILQEVEAICQKAVLIDKGNIILELNEDEISIERLEREFLSIKN